MVVLLLVLPAHARCILESESSEPHQHRGTTELIDQRTWTVDTGAADCAVVPLRGTLVRAFLHHPDDTRTRLHDDRVFPGVAGPELHVPELRLGDQLTVRTARLAEGTPAPAPEAPPRSAQAFRVGEVRDGLLVLGEQGGAARRLPAPGGFVRLGDLLGLPDPAIRDAYLWLSHEGPGGPPVSWQGEDDGWDYTVTCSDAPGWLQCGAHVEGDGAPPPAFTRVLDHEFRVWQ